MKDRYGKEIPIGKSYSNKYGTYTLVEYRSAKDVTIEWESPFYRGTAQIVDVNRGNVKNPLAPAILGVACFGIGPHIAYTEDKVTVKSYSCWKAMVQRCYDEKFRHKWQSYADCFVCDEWLNYQNFADWYVQNYREDWQLDKDILIKDNKIYSPETCMFVPKEINRLFIRNKSVRGKYPIGVTMSKKVTPRYHAACCNEFNKQTHIGTFNTPEEAFFAYKIFKEDVVKKIAERFKDQISSQLYSILLSYEVAQDD